MKLFLTLYAHNVGVECTWNVAMKLYTLYTFTFRCNVSVSFSENAVYVTHKTLV